MPSNERMIWALISLNAIHEITKWCIDNPGPISEATISRVHGCIDGCLFWCLRLLGIPATADSPNPPPPSLHQGESYKFYLYISHFMNLLSHYPRIYEDVSRKEAFLDLVIALWTSQYDGSTPLYRDLKRDKDPMSDQVEKAVAVFHRIASVNPRGLCNAITSGRVCTPETFSRRTIKWLRKLCDVHELPHLSHIVSSPTIEISNVALTVFAMQNLMDHDDFLKALFLEEDAPRKCMKVVQIHAQRLKLLIAHSLDFSRPLGSTNEQAGMKRTAQISVPVSLALKMAASSSTSTLSHVKDVLQAGAAELAVRMFATILPWSSGLRGNVDSVWEFIERYSLYLETIPILSKAIRSYPLRPQTVKPTMPVGRPDLPDVSKRIVMFQPFTKHRVRLCDSLKVRSTSATYSQNANQHYLPYSMGTCSPSPRPLHPRSVPGAVQSHIAPGSVSETIGVTTGKSVPTWPMSSLVSGLANSS